MMQRASVVFPQPLSPTTPRVSPAETDRSTPFNALMVAALCRQILRWSGNAMRKSLTESKGCVGSGRESHAGITYLIGRVQPAAYFASVGNWRVGGVKLSHVPGMLRVQRGWTRNPLGGGLNPAHSREWQVAGFPFSFPHGGWISIMPVYRGVTGHEIELPRRPLNHLPQYMTMASVHNSAKRPRLWVMNNTAMDSSLCNSRINSIICAWVVTSRAVVGSSANQQVRIANQCNGKHDTLAHSTT